MGVGGETAIASRRADENAPRDETRRDTCRRPSPQAECAPSIGIIHATCLSQGPEVQRMASHFDKQATEGAEPPRLALRVATTGTFGSVTTAPLRTVSLVVNTVTAE